MENTNDELLNTRQADLPKIIPTLVNRRDEEPNYEFTTQNYLILAYVGDGRAYFRYVTLKATPAEVTAWFEEDLKCIGAKVDSIALEWEDDF